MKTLAVITLIINFIKSAFISGWETARIILLRPDRVRSGLTCMPYDDLSPAQASLISALITLAPGTTTVDVDIRKQQFQLHLLDLERRDDIVRDIYRDFIEPLRRFNGVNR